MTAASSQQSEQGQSAPIIFTIFDNVYAQKLREHSASLDEICKWLANPKEHRAKADCSLIKLARFGAQRSNGDSLRNDSNVVAVTGVEGDYDGEQVSIDEAAKRLTKAGIEAVVYTSPSHRDDKPRWRVLAPLSRECVPEQRRKFCARLNGALGGILGAESFTLSQAYYVGRVNGSPYEWRRVQGIPIDLRGDLDATAAEPPPAGGANSKQGDSRRERRHRTQTDPAILRLREQGLVLHERNDGVVDITCPFAGEHTTPSANSSTTYFPAHTGGFATAKFVCLHSHCKGRLQEDFLAAIGMQEGEWPDPEPLRESIAARPYPLDALPPIVLSAVKEVTDFSRAPVCLVAASALGVASIACQALADVRRDGKLIGPVSLFMLVIAESGERKTTCDAYFSRPLTEWCARQIENMKPLLAKYRANLDAWESQRAGLREAIKRAASVAAKPEKPDPGNKA